MVSIMSKAQVDDIVGSRSTVLRPCKHFKEVPAEKALSDLANNRFEYIIFRDDHGDGVSSFEDSQDDAGLTLSRVPFGVPVVRLESHRARLRHCN